MRICFVPGFLYQGGAQRWLVELVRDAALRGHDVTLLLDFPTDEPAFYGRLPENVRLWYISPTRWTEGSPEARAWHAKRTPALARFVLANARELLSFDIVHVFATRLLPFMWLQLRRLTRSPLPRFVETYTGYFHEFSPNFRRIGFPHFWAHFDAISGAVDSVARREVAAQLPGVRMPVIMFGVPAPDVASVTAEERLAYRRASGIPDDARWVVGSVQRLHPTRRPWELVDIYAAIARRLGEGVHFLHAGDGPSRAEVEQRAAAVGLADRWHFVGGVADVRWPFSVIDVHVIQVWEGGVPGASGFESTLVGVPTVGIDFTPYGYAPMPSDLVWASKDPEAIAERVVALLLDDERRAALGLAQRTQANAECSLEACGAGYERLYREIMQAHGRAVAPAAEAPVPEWRPDA